MHAHDFRSDTVTLPTAEMMRRVATAELGDAARGDDPSVNELERLGAKLAGKAGAIFLPSGTMANLSAVIAHGCRGGEVIVEADAHIYNSEGGGLSAVAGAVPRPLAGTRGVLDAAAVEAAIRDEANLALAPTRLICLENTHNTAGGTVTSPTQMAALHQVARRHGVPVHLDGARLFNAATHLGIEIEQLCRHTDSVWFALCKGLGGPVGALLAGDAPFIRKARAASRMLGGGMRQAGLIAAPAIVALDEPYTRLRRDHVLARKLGAGLAEIDRSLVDLETVQTNIVNCHVAKFAPKAAPVVEALQARGILANAKGRMIRFVTHSEVDERSVADALQAMRAVLKAHAAAVQ